MSESKLPFYTTQLPGKVRVAERGYENIYWSYDADPTITPARFFGNGEGYPTKCDPAPMYGHDLERTQDILERLHEFAPLCAPVTVSVFRVFDKRNSNGWAQQHQEYYDCYTPEACECDVVVPKGEKGEDGSQPVTTYKRNWDGVIALNGRTTEIHPAITRYVVPHEYGHILEDALGLIRYPHEKSDQGRLVVREWAKVRGIPEENFDLKYAVNTHHLMPGEVFANDFRFMFGAEREWWPHEDVVPHLFTGGQAAAIEWWQTALEELRDCYHTAVAALDPA